MATVFLASALGWYLVVFGLFILLRKEHLASVMKELMGHRDLFFILAIFTFTLGLLMVLSHNVWIMGWPVVVTLFCWLILISGLIRLFFPEYAIKMAQSFLNQPRRMVVAAILFILLGIYLLAHIYYW